MTATVTSPTSDQAAARSWSERITSALDKNFWKYAFAFLLLFLVCAVVEDLRLKMWNDEIVTLYVAQQGSPAEIVQATKEGMDTTPPLYPIIVSVILPIIKPDALAVRLPSTVGFTAMLFFVLAFCRGRMPAVYAFIAALVVVVACGFYATEGRCYGMVLGCAAGVLFCWRAATEHNPRFLWLTLLAVFLALATALHYYSVFLLLPLGVAEVLRWRRTRRLDFAMLAAMLPALAVLVLHYPLIAAGRKYLSHFWAPGLASWGQIPDFYLQFAIVPGGVILLSLIVAATISLDGPRPSLPSHEWIAVGALALLPVFIITASKYTTHVFVARYALSGVIGLAILSAALLWSSSNRRPLVGIAVLAAVFAIFAGRLLRDIYQAPPTLRQGGAIYRELQHLPVTAEPIVIAYNHAFMELSYYAEPQIRERLVYPLSREVEMKYTGSDLDYLLLSAVRHRTKLNYVDLDAFLASNPRFILVAMSHDYLQQYLLTSGFRLVPLSSMAGPDIFEVLPKGTQ